MTASDPSTLESRLRAAVADADRQAGAHGALAAALAEVRSRVRQAQASLEPLSKDLASADARAALASGLTSLRGLEPAVAALQPRHPLREAFDGFTVEGPVPCVEIAGCPSYLRLTIQAVAEEAGGARVRATAEGALVRIEAHGAREVEPQGYAAQLARRLASRIGAEVSVPGGHLELRMAASATSAPQAPRTLLIVDDEPELAPMFRRFLKKHFSEILEARDAPAAVVCLQAKAVTHVVVDASLPNGESGQTLAQRIRALAPSVRFVALFSGSTSLRGSSLPGVDRVFIKPEGFDELVLALRG